MNVYTLTLTDFLLARIAEDEAAANAAAEGYADDGTAPAWSRRHWERRLHAGPVASFVIAQSPARVLAECEAKRRIVEWSDSGYAAFKRNAEDVLRILAAVYADHPDYRQEWRP